MTAVRRALLGVLLAGLLVPTAAAQARRRVSSPIAFYDDADVADPGLLTLSSYFSYNRVPVGRDIGFPAAGFTLGLQRRLDVSGNVALAHSQFEESRITGAGDSDIGLCVLLLPEGSRRPAVAVKPTLEILGDASLRDNPLAPDRVNYILPVMTQKSFESFRLYYSAGYASRGIVFHSLAWELNRWTRVVPAVIVSSSRLTRELDLVSELGLKDRKSVV